MLTILIALTMGVSAPAPVEPIDPAEDMGVECVLVSEDPEVWQTSGMISLPCGPSLDGLPPVDVMPDEHGCTPAASSENCPGDISTEPIVVETSAPDPVVEVVQAVEEAPDDVLALSVERRFSQQIRAI